MSVANVLKLHGDITGVTLRGLSWKKILNTFIGRVNPLLYKFNLFFCRNR